MTPRNTALVMLRAPRRGEVKSRLAATVGETEALRVYRILVEHQMSQIPPDWRVEVHFTPPDAGREMREWLGTRAVYQAQAGNDLGERLIAAMGSAASGGGGPFFLIGGDCPGLRREVLERAARQLARADVVIAPAVDGGYVLLGLKSKQPALFRGIDWGTPRVCTQTVERIADAGLSLARLPALEDVDDEASWARNRIPNPPS